MGLHDSFVVYGRVSELDSDGLLGCKCYVAQM